MTHHVYTIWRDRTPLYVGCTNNLRRRMQQHAGKPWMAEATFIAAVPFESRVEALKAEAYRIHKLMPIHNIDCNPRDAKPVEMFATWLNPEPYPVSARERKRVSLLALRRARDERLGVPA